jgi:preprotein translocase subunit SecG
MIPALVRHAARFILSVPVLQNGVTVWPLALRPVTKPRSGMASALIGSAAGMDRKRDRPDRLGPSPLPTLSTPNTRPPSRETPPLITVLLIMHLFVTIALIGVVLIQRSEGGGLGIGGSQGMGAFMSGRGTANLLTRTTAILATIFLVLSMALALLNRGTPSAGSHGLFSNMPAAPAHMPAGPAPKPAAPAQPAPAAPPAPQGPQVPTH